MRGSVGPYTDNLYWIPIQYLSLQYFTRHTVSYSVDDALKAYTIHHMHTAILHSAATEDQTIMKDILLTVFFFALIGVLLGLGM